MSESGGCEATVTGRKRCGWIMLRMCGELLYGKRFLSMAERGCLQEVCKACSAVLKRIMVLYEILYCIYFMNDGEICGESNVWSTDQR